MLAATFLDHLTGLFRDPTALFVVGILLVVTFFWYFATDNELRKRNIGTGLLFAVGALCILAIIPPKERLKGGIDIVGGSSFTLSVQPRTQEDGTTTSVTTQQVDQAIAVIEKRLNGLGTTEPLIIRQGTDSILVQMPGVEPEESAKIKETLEKVARLELRQVHQRTEELAPRVVAGEESVPGYKVFNQKGKNAEGVEFTHPILISRRVALTGADISNAMPSLQQSGTVDIVLNAKGEDKMIALTQNMTPRVDRIAIILDGEVLSAPVVESVPLGKQFIINGLDKPGEAQNLANALMNPLENPLKMGEFRLISPLLGEAVVKQGIIAGLIGLSITFAFVLIYYRLAGLVALVGLLMNGVILFGVMAMFGFTFSLPGIAGMILSIGMAVDANVLIYERLREEIEAGKSIKNAISAAYDKAFSAILDANVTSLITAIILLWLGTSSIKGFAITLIIGIVASMFSSILLTRVLFRWGLDLGILKKLSFLNLIRATNYDFLGKRGICMAISFVLLAASVGSFVWRKQTALGIDFTGGTQLSFQLGQNPTVHAHDVEALFDSMNLEKAAFAQEESNPATGTLLTIRCDSGDADKLEAKIRETFPALGEKAPDSKPGYNIPSNKVEISGAVGEQFLKTSVVALLLGIAGILIYTSIRFEVAFAVGTFAALLHDVVISVGMVVLFGGELSLIHVGAILTIAGYSVNDTIVVFDRVRETMHQRTGSLASIMNEAVNATLSRTLLTSVTTIVTVAILSFFGGSNLRDFSVMILLGLLIGTYSSIFVAAPVALWWNKLRGDDLRGDLVNGGGDSAIEVIESPKYAK